MSRAIADLRPETRERHAVLMHLASVAGFGWLLTDGLRLASQQAILYRRGRPLASIQAKADELSDRWQRPDLAQLLMDAPAQAGPKGGIRPATWAGPGQSGHQYGVALDGVPTLGGKPLWDDETPEDLDRWLEWGRLLVAAGFEWAGYWTQHRERPHGQLPGFDWREHIQECPCT